jgi:(p)ppGpp synthase/HD superfamily hydrolase
MLPERTSILHSTPYFLTAPITQKPPVQSVHFASIAPNQDNGVHLTKQFAKAATWANEIYGGVYRRDTGSPYIEHSLSSAAYVLDDGGSETEAIAALLQGALKYSHGKVTLNDIEKRFGAKVARLVEESSEKKIRNWHACKTFYISSFKSVSPEARRVISAVMLHNIQSLNRTLSIEGWPHWKKYKGGREPSLKFYNNAVQELKRVEESNRETSLEKEGSTLVKELEREVSLLNRVANNAPTKGHLKKPSTPRKLSHRFFKALEQVIELHDPQRRRDTGAPYAIHLFCVAATILDNGGSEDTAIAGLFHDGPEDIGEKAKEILSHPPYHGCIKTMVEDCTEKPGPTWESIKQGYIDHLPHVKKPQSLLIVQADKLSNLRTMNRSLRAMGDDYWKLFRGDKYKQLWFYTEVTKQLKVILGKTPLIQEIERELEALRELMKVT